MKRFFLAIFLVVLFPSHALGVKTACFPQSSGWTGCLPVVTIPTEWTRCTSDAECVEVAWSCCPCETLGLSVAINPSHLVEYHKRWHKLCPGMYDPYYPSYVPPNPVRCPQAIACPTNGTDASGESIYAYPFCTARGRCEFGFR
jgi:hypothetical protein